MPYQNSPPSRKFRNSLKKKSVRPYVVGRKTTFLAAGFVFSEMLADSGVCVNQLRNRASNDRNLAGLLVTKTRFADQRIFMSYLKALSGYLIVRPPRMMVLI